MKRIAQAKSPTTYSNNGLANGLKFVASAIDDGFGARFYMIGLGGFDTHGNQKQQHANLLTTLGDGIAAFQADLEARGIADEVVTMTFSEFGRRAQENASQGTDHGAAAPLFIIGKGVKGGMVGEAPRLDQLDHGDVQWKIDFRQVYATLLDRWVGVSSEAVLGGKFEPLGVI